LRLVLGVDWGGRGFVTHGGILARGHAAVLEDRDISIILLKPQALPNCREDEIQSTSMLAMRSSTHLLCPP
jgi:hypothetical protein